MNAYIQKYYGHFIIIILYVNDIFISGIIVASILVVKDALHDAFEMSYLGLLKPFLGLGIAQNSYGIMVTQYQYI